eukprot:Blabericola_migrator_1__5611@NODE_2854_length_2284_cov_85_475417_g1790_i0_p1_GENE_NODE_2854_length_2284_cov_85_475417_g1790_i0NODE_2854_length_2284_cov_85_475417_g1790_i0_p1_ORF_typecomplete_len576_score99_90GCR1_C/PF12550_8/1_3GCR1_C/PF12550_8/2_1e02DNA_photolyase/PF00875_18/1e03DNA_photolyase/PF00875_18/2_9e02DNA_photolyase/PF00875_18/9AAA_13/PF13166_6/26AAA_13/PF13166_6/5_5_NODE_2854_length_2284_cov_85_475417_g1790_i0831810
MFVQSLVQSVKRNVTKALTSSSIDLGKDHSYPLVTIHEFVSHWEPEITRSCESRTALKSLTSKLLTCVTGSRLTDRIYESPVFYVKELGVKELLTSLICDTGDMKVDDILTLPFSSDTVLPTNLMLKFGHLFVSSGMCDLYITQLCHNPHLVESEDVIPLLRTLSIRPSLTQMLIELFLKRDLSGASHIPDASHTPVDLPDVLHNLLKEWKLEALQTTIDSLWDEYVTWLPQVPSRENLESQEPSPSGRTPSSSAESSSPVAEDPYLKWQETAAKQRQQIERREHVINLGTLALRLEHVYNLASKASEDKVLSLVSDFGTLIKAFHIRIESQVEAEKAKQLEQESRFEKTKADVSGKLIKELEDLRGIKENTGRERAKMEQELQALRAQVVLKEAELESLLQKEQRISELFCQIAGEMDSLNRQFTEFSTPSEAAIEQEKLLEDLIKLENEIQKDCSDLCIVERHGASEEELKALIEEYMTEAIPSFYDTLQGFIKLGCDRLKSQSPSSRGGSVYRPTLAQTSVYLDRQSKQVENALRELSMLAPESQTQYSSTLKQAYLSCRQLLKTNHQLIFA